MSKAGAIGALNLVEIDPELFGVSDDDAAARRAAMMRAFALPAGTRLTEWRTRDGIGLYVADGILLRDLRVGRAASVELVGQGDVIQPWSTASDRVASIPAECDWRVLTPTTLGVLDAAFVERVARVSPRTVAGLFERSIERSTRLAYFLAIHKLVLVKDRVLLALWRLADRWGRVRGDGIVIAVPHLTHELLAELIGARRPSVSTAVSRLGREGLLRRDPDGLWVLTGPARPAAPPAPAWGGRRRRTAAPARPVPSTSTGR